MSDYLEVSKLKKQNLFLKTRQKSVKMEKKNADAENPRQQKCYNNVTVF
jgi:hypothetical protein